MSLFSEIALTRYGRMIVNRHCTYIGQALIDYGEYSEGEAETFRSLLLPDDWVIEAGANIGALTVPIARHCSQGHILAFEPQRLNYQMLCGNIALNSLLNVEPLPYAVGAECGTIGVTEFCPHLPNNSGGIPLGLENPTYQVQCVTIDSLNLPKCDFIKADVEGMEYDVLYGGYDTIQKFRPILYLEDDRQDKSEKLHQHLKIVLDYRIYRHMTYLYNPSNWRTNPNNLYPGIVTTNLLCIPRERDDIPIDGLPEV